MSIFDDLQRLPEVNATKSRDYGRGYAQAIRDVVSVLRHVPEYEWALDRADRNLERTRAEVASLEDEYPCNEEGCEGQATYFGVCSEHWPTNREAVVVRVEDDLDLW